MNKLTTEEEKLVETFVNQMNELVKTPEFTKLVNDETMQTLTRTAVAFVMESGRRYAKRGGTMWSVTTEKGFLFLFGYLYGKTYVSNQENKSDSKPV